MPSDYADVVILDAFDGLRVPGSLATTETLCGRPTGVAVAAPAVIMNLADEHRSAGRWACLAGMAEHFRAVGGDRGRRAV